MFRAIGGMKGPVAAAVAASSGSISPSLCPSWSLVKMELNAIGGVEALQLNMMPSSPSSPASSVDTVGHVDDNDEKLKDQWRGFIQKKERFTAALVTANLFRMFAGDQLSARDQPFTGTGQLSAEQIKLSLNEYTQPQITMIQTDILKHAETILAGKARTSRTAGSEWKAKYDFEAKLWEAFVSCLKEGFQF